MFQYLKTLVLLLARYDFSSIDTLDPVVMKKEKKKLKNVALSFLLNLGAGVGGGMMIILGIYIIQSIYSYILYVQILWYSYIPFHFQSIISLSS